MAEGGFINAEGPNTTAIPKITNIFGVSEDFLGQLKTWLEQNPPSIPITQIVGFDLNAAVPAGAVFSYAGASAPSNYLLCDGTAVSRTQYSTLFSAIGTSYGIGDGSTTFNLPDLRGRTAVGYAASGGHTDVSTLGNSDGVSAANRRPKHRHTAHSHSITSIDAANHTAASGAVGYTAGDRSTINVSGTGSADGGSGNSSDSLDAPAYLVVNYIIKT